MRFEFNLALFSANEYIIYSTLLEKYYELRWYYESQPTINEGIQAEFEVNLSKLAANIDSLSFVLSADTPLN